MRIANNFPALTAFNSLNGINKKLQKAVNALSTGLRINSSSDDAAGFAISENMRSQISGLDIAIKNSQDGVSLLQTAEGAMAQTNSMLQRMRELAVQASNTALTSNDRQYIQNEIDEIKNQIDIIANSTEFNKKRILDGSSGAVSSSSDTNLKAKINGGLTYVDEFGQKVSSEGNYRIEIEAEGGKSQVQKTAPMLIKNDNVTKNKAINNSAGVNNVIVKNLPTGRYYVTSEETKDAQAFITGAYGLSLTEINNSLHASAETNSLTKNASILFEVTDVNEQDKNITLRATANILGTDGKTDTIIEDITLKEEKYNDLSELLNVGDSGAFELQLKDGAAENFNRGDKFVYNLSVADGVEGADRFIKITNDNTTDETQEIYKTNPVNLKDNIFVPAKVLFLVDDSASMQSMIDTVKNNVVNFVSNIKNNGADEVSIGVASYSAWPNGVHTLRKHTMSGNDWSKDLTEVQNALSDITPKRGSEDHYKAITDAINEYDIQNGGDPAFIIVVTDTYQEINNGVSKHDAIDALKNAGVFCSVIRPENERAMNDLDEIADTTEGLKLNQTSPTWGNDLSEKLGAKIGHDALNSIALIDFPVYQFENFSSIFPNSSSPSQTITINQDGTEYQITIEATNSFNDIADKIEAATGFTTNTQINQNKKSVSIIMDFPSTSSIKVSGNAELLDALGFRSNCEHEFSLNSEAVKNTNIHFRQFYINAQNGQIYDSDIIITSDYEKELENIDFYSEFNAAGVGDVPAKDTKLSDINSFFDPQGVFMLENPKTLTITQGNGQSTEIILYENDTIEDARKKINDAIANGLGQAKYVNNADKFVSYIEEGENLTNGEETVPGTFVIRSAVPGKAGEIYFSGDEDLLNALGLNTIQESEEAVYTASVYDAHSGVAVKTNIKSSEPEFTSLIPPEIDIEVEPMTGLTANWDENTKRFIMARKNVYTAMLHLKNNGTVFQIGTNKGEDFSIQLGDISSKSLGISTVNVLTKETASRAISTIDKAINQLASQRAKVGAYENSLERTMENLTVISANLTTAESRIRDADMSLTMMNFVKYQILNQSGTSMLAQANQMPQSVLNLMQ